MLTAGHTTGLHLSNVGPAEMWTGIRSGIFVGKEDKRTVLFGLRSGRIRQVAPMFPRATMPLQSWGYAVCELAVLLAVTRQSAAL